MTRSSTMEQETLPRFPCTAWARVRLMTGSSPAAEWTVSSDDGTGRLTVGASERCDWPVFAPGVNPAHAELVWDGSVLWVVPTGGAVCVDGERLHAPLPARRRTFVVLGGAVLLVEPSDIALLSSGPATPADTQRMDAAPDAGPSDDEWFGGPTVIDVPAFSSGYDPKRTMPMGSTDADVARAPTPVVAAPALDPRATVLARPARGGPTDPQVTQSFRALSSQPASNDETVAPSCGAVPPRPHLGQAARSSKKGDWKRRVQFAQGPPARGSETKTAPPSPADTTPPGSGPADEGGPEGPWRVPPPSVPPAKRPNKRRMLLLLALFPPLLWLAFGGQGAPDRASRAAAAAPAVAQERAGEAGGDGAEGEPEAQARRPAVAPAAPPSDAPGAPEEARIAEGTRVAEPAEPAQAEPAPPPLEAGAQIEAIELVAAGRYEEAEARYELLASQHPDHEAFGVVAEILRAKIRRACEEGGAPCDR